MFTTQEPALIPTTLPDLILQYFFDDFEIVKEVFDLLGTAIPRPAAIGFAASLPPTEILGVYTATTGAFVPASGVFESALIGAQIAYNVMLLVTPGAYGKATTLPLSVVDQPERVKPLRVDTGAVRIDSPSVNEPALTGLPPEAL